MKLPPITPEQFKLSIPAIQHVAEKAGACPPFLWNLENCDTPGRMASFLMNHADEIAKKLGARMEMEYDIERIKKHLKEEEPLTEAEHIEIMRYEYSAHEVLQMMIKVAGQASMINEMKLELFMQIINEVSLGDVEQLYIKHRPNSYEASNQMKLAV